MYMKLTPRQQLAKKLYKELKTYFKVGKEMGVTRQWAHRLVNPEKYLTANRNRTMTYTNNTELNDLQKKIIQEWEKTIIVHPSYRNIANKVGCSKETVGRAVQKYLLLNK